MKNKNGIQNNPSSNLIILSQYIKDLSFESPNSPYLLQLREKSLDINISVNVNANPLSNNDFDVILSLSVEAKDNDTIIFHLELVYGGIFRIIDFPQEHMLPILFIECPRLLFPFARQIVADVTRNGGFRPLMIDPIDFSQMFTQQIIAEKGNSKIKNIPN